MISQRAHRTRWLRVLGLLLGLAGSAWAAGTPAGTTISNFATLTYKDGNGNALPEITSNTVNTVVSQVAGVDVTPATANGTVAGGGSVTFALTVTNTGNGTDTLSLSYPSLSTGWAGLLYRDLDRNGVLATAEQVEGNIVSSVSLAADSSAYVIFYVTAPLSAVDLAAEAVTVTATSKYNSSTKDAGVYTANVATAGLTVSKAASTANPKPGDVITYTISTRSTGSAAAYSVVISDTLPANVTYVSGSLRLATGDSPQYETATSLSDASDADRGDYGGTSGSTITVNWGNSVSGEKGTIYFRVQVNSAVAAGTTIANTATVRYRSTPTGTQQPPVQGGPASSTVGTKVGLTLSSSALAQSGQPSDTLKYAFTLTNDTNAGDKYQFGKASTGSYTSVIWNDVNNDGIAGNGGDVALTDSDSDGRVDTGTIASGTVVRLLVAVVIPAGSADLAEDITSLTVKSATDSTVTGTVTLTTTVHAPVLSIVKSVSPTGAQPPGTVLTYTVVITNAGHGSATQLQMVDMIPTNTTYQTGTITVDSASRTDADDSDEAKLQGGSSIVVQFTSVAAGASKTVAFQVKID